MSKLKDQDPLFPPPPAWIEPFGPRVGLAGISAVTGALLAFALAEGAGRLGHALWVVLGAAAGYGALSLPWETWLPTDADDAPEEDAPDADTPAASPADAPLTGSAPADAPPQAATPAAPQADPPVDATQATDAPTDEPPVDAERPQGDA